jgi:hypothetical protein
VKDVALQSNYHFTADENGEPKLKRTSVWYDQVQGQLWVTQRDWCDFVLFTLNGPLGVERIYADTDWIDSVVPRLNNFYDRNVFPAILMQK